MLATREGLKVEQLPEHTKFENLVNSCISGVATPKGDLGGGVAISSKKREALQLLVSPIRARDAVWHRRPAAIVLINDPSREVRPPQAALRGLFGLTPAECRIALLVAGGYSKREIVERVGVSTNTVKSHLSAIFVKTGLRRQAELVKLLSLLPNEPDIPPT
ncbi:MAG: hypothetical protein NVS1B11_01780 [Terriglobales bacterium]